MNYLDTNIQLDESTFDKEEFFYTIDDFLTTNNIPADDLKANISGEDEWDDFVVNAHFSFILYPEDVPKKNFKKFASNLENSFKKQFSNILEEVDCTRYEDSEYSNNGYDVDLTLRICYKLKN